MPAAHGASPRPATEAELIELVRARATGRAAPLVVAVDGRSGVGKSTLARRLGIGLDAAILDGDDFFAGGVEVRHDTPRDRARDCIDWRSQRRVLTQLRAGMPATYHAFDWDAFDGSTASRPTVVEPRPIVLLEGVYSARPELEDLVDLRVLAEVSDATRMQRLLAREQALGSWERQWHEAEAWYFERVAPRAWFHALANLE